MSPHPNCKKHLKKSTKVDVPFHCQNQRLFLSIPWNDPDLPQPPNAYLSAALDRYQGNMTKKRGVTKKVYIERIEDPRGLVTRQRSVVRVAAEWV